MRLLRKPTQAEIETFLRDQSRLDYSYKSVGGTQSQLPIGFDVDCNRVLLGRGEVVFERACQALQRWQMFPKGWTEIQPADADQKSGTVVAMLAFCFGRWWLNSCRVVYSLDENKPTRRYGFAYGTLPGHVERGEERFMIERDRDDQVWYEIYSFSRPRHWLVRLTYPLSRRPQKRFIRQSLAQMQQAVLADYTPSGISTQ